MMCLVCHKNDCDGSICGKLQGGFTLLFISDTHFVWTGEYEFHPAVKAVIQFIREYRPEVIVLGGDIMDMTSISPHILKGGNISELEAKRLKEDFGLTRTFLDIITRDVFLIEYLEGNHENWAVKFEERIPGLTGLLGIQENLKLDEYGIGWTPVNQVLKIGKLNFIHGWYVNKYHASKHLDDMGDHIVYGHTHDHQKIIRPTRAQREPYLSMSCGCLCDLNPYYLRNKPNRWVNGFGLFEVMPDMTFSAHFLPVIAGRFIWDGFEWGVD